MNDDALCKLAEFLSNTRLSACGVRDCKFRLSGRCSFKMTCIGPDGKCVRYEPRAQADEAA